LKTKRLIKDLKKMRENALRKGDKYQAYLALEQLRLLKRDNVFDKTFSKKVLRRSDRER
jgi:hypothetical protein